MRSIPADTADRVSACQAEGLTQFETAVKTGVSLSTVRKFWKSGTSRRNVSPAMIREEQKKGRTQQEIADSLGVSISKVRMYWASVNRAGRPSNSEARVASLIEQGKTDRQIAEELGLAVSTVNRRRNAMKKEERARTLENSKNGQ